MVQRECRPCLLFVIGMKSTKIGGMEKFLKLLCVRLNHAGWSTVLCFDGESSSQVLAYFELPFVTVENLPNQDGLGQKASSALWKLLKKHRPTVFMYAFHSIRRVFPMIAKAAGVKRILFNDHSSRPQGWKPVALRLDKRVIARVLTSPLSRIISVSEFTRSSGASFKMTTAPNVVVRNGIELLDIDRGIGAQFRQKYGIPADALVVTEVCWMVPAKGVDVLLEAAASVLARHRQVHLVFVGGGELLEDYRAQAAQMESGDRVHFLGIINEPVNAGVFDATDIYCQPSLWQEASGLAVLEAMSKRVPVVASNLGGLPENITQGTTGLLVPSNESKALENALEQLINDRDLRIRLGAAGRHKVEADHRLEDMVDRYVALITQE